MVLKNALSVPISIPGGIFGTPVGLDPDFRSQRTRTLCLTRDPPESQFEIVNTDNVDQITVRISQESLDCELKQKQKQRF